MRGSCISLRRMMRFMRRQGRRARACAAGEASRGTQRLLVDRAVAGHNVSSLSCELRVCALAYRLLPPRYLLSGSECSPQTSSASLELCATQPPVPQLVGECVLLDSGVASPPPRRRINIDRNLLTATNLLYHDTTSAAGPHTTPQRRPARPTTPTSITSHTEIYTPSTLTSINSPS